MEYLMTYGWALLVIVVVGAALFALGVLNPSTYTQKRCQGFQYFTYQDQKAVGGASGVISLDLVNGPSSITITQITWGGTVLTNLGGTTAPVGGQGFVVSGTYPGTAGTTGNSYSNVAVTVRYDVTNGISGNLDRGTCSGTYA